MTTHRSIRAACLLACIAAACAVIACTESQGPLAQIGPLSPDAVRPPSTSFELSGTAIGDDGTPISNTQLWVNHLTVDGRSSPGTPGMTDGEGRYTVNFEAARGRYSLGSTAMVYIGAAGYEHEYRWFRPTTPDSRYTLDLHPRLIRQMDVGESMSVTVGPNDTQCINNVQDIPGLGGSYLCRKVRIVIRGDGELTVDVASTTPGGLRPPLAIETIEHDDCCFDGGLKNPRRMLVTAGDVVIVNVEILEGTPSQSFVVTSTIQR